MRISDIIRMHSKTIPISELRILIVYVLNSNLEKILLNIDKELSNTDLSKVESLIKRRVAKEPIAYITNKKEFYSYEFYVDNSVLIPRPDTELLVDEALKYIRNFKYTPKILDLCTGSGCIAISIALNSDSIIYASDYSIEALEIAKKNAVNLIPINSINFIHSNWFDKIPNIKFDIIVSNPPYISSEEKNIMSEETLLYEPKTALFSGFSGLEAYQVIALNANNYLADEGKIILECGINQKDKILDIFLQHNLILENASCDLSNITRCLSFKKIS